MHPRRTNRRRSALVLTGAVVVSLNGCGLVGDEAEPPPTSTTRAPLETTTTTEATTTTASVEEGPDLPEPGVLLENATNTVDTTANVTIRGTMQLPLEDGEPTKVEVEAEGSAGPAGESRTVMRIVGGDGTARMRVINNHHYLKADDAWAEARSWGWAQQRLTGQWLKLPAENSPLTSHRPHALLDGTEFPGSFSSEMLTDEDWGHSIVTTAKQGDVGEIDAGKVKGQWTYRVDLADVGDQGSKVQRVIWTTTDMTSPRILKQTFGRYPNRSELFYTEWGTSSESFSKPDGAKKVKKDRFDSI